MSICSVLKALDILLEWRLNCGERPALQSIVIDLGIQGKVTFYGNVKETWNWYHNIDIFISNSYSESLQVALLEAMVSGCYCLSHRWDGTEELLPGANLYYSGNELEELILIYSEKTDEEKLLQKKLMNEIVAVNCGVDKINGQIRQVVEEVGNAGLS